MAEEENEQKTQEDIGTDESPDETEETIDSGSSGSFLSPEALLMFPLAVLLDSIGLILLVFALDDFFITDIIGIVMIGGWTLFRSRQMQMTKGAQTKIAKAGKRMKRLRPLLVIGELIPYVGALPCWTILVYFELKS